MMKVKPEYDSFGVKDAFKDSVMGITVKPKITDPCPPEFIPDGNINTAGQSDDWDTPMIMDRILSLYINWGITDSLYAISEALFTGERQLLR